MSSVLRLFIKLILCLDYNLIGRVLKVVSSHGTTERLSFFTLFRPEEHEGLVSLLPLCTLLFHLLHLLLLGLT